MIHLNYFGRFLDAAVLVGFGESQIVSSDVGHDASTLVGRESWLKCVMGPMPGSKSASCTSGWSERVNVHMGVVSAASKLNCMLPNAGGDGT